MAEVESTSVHSEDHEIDEEWDVVDEDNELEQLTGHFEKGGVGASLLLDDYTAPTTSVDINDAESKRQAEVIASLRNHIASNEARIAELEHELSYADKARVNAEQRNAQLCATNSALSEENRAMSEKIAQMENKTKSLEKNTEQLESFVEETITNSQSGYTYLCEARESVSAITKELMGLRSFLNGDIGGLASGMGGGPLGFEGGVLQSVMSDLQVTLSVYREVFADVSSAVRQLKTIAAKVPPIPPDRDRSNKIALTNFNQGDVTMFFPTPKGDYVAFNIGTPHHYLSEESKSLIGHDPHFKKVYVLGRIIIKEEKVAPMVDPPYNLKPGTTYYEISVESISDMFPAAAMRGSDHKFRENTDTSTSSRRRKP